VLTTTRLAGTDLDVSRLCFGGNIFGWTADETASFLGLDAFFEAGGNFIDTADVYSSWHPGNVGGESEEIIGKWITSRGLQDSVVVASKGGGLPPHDGLSEKAVTGAIDASLRRFGVSRIDLWYSHFDDPKTEQHETICALQKAIDAGKVRHVGASNFREDRVVSSLATAREAGLEPYRAVQLSYNLLVRDHLTPGLRELAGDGAVSLIAHSALASGALTGKYTDAPAETHREKMAQRFLSRPGTAERVARLRSVAESRGVAMSTVAVAWVLAQPEISAAVASARSPEQLHMLLAGADLSLDPAEVQVLQQSSVGTDRAE
jgi:aryl-alcohol dehydrogenase-like predicted oxidoreductase